MTTVEENKKNEDIPEDPYAVLGDKKKVKEINEEFEEFSSPVI